MAKQTRKKIKHDILTQDYKYGGIKMPNIYHVITSLKLTWMRRLFLNDTKWVNLFNSTTGLTTKDIIIHGDYFITLKCKKIQNAFWKDVLISWVLMQEKLNIENDKDVQGLNIWYNTKILKHNRPFLYTSYIEKGIVFINDLLDERGKILDFQSFKNRYNLETNFLNYLSLVNAEKIVVIKQHLLLAKDLCYLLK